MRGFRGSRAAQAFNARFNRNQGRPGDRDPGHSPQGQGQAPSQRPPLPDWLKTPETKAQEAVVAPKPQLKLVPQPVPAESQRTKATPKKASSQPSAQKVKGRAPARKTSAARSPKKKAS